MRACEGGMKGGNQNPREQARGAISVGVLALERGHPESWQESPFAADARRIGGVRAAGQAA